jgi:hypothetical protein
MHTHQAPRDDPQLVTVQGALLRRSGGPAAAAGTTTGTAAGTATSTAAGTTHGKSSATTAAAAPAATTGCRWGHGCGGGARARTCTSSGKQPQPREVRAAAATTRSNQRKVIRTILTHARAHTHATSELGGTHTHTAGAEKKAGHPPGLAGAVGALFEPVCAGCHTLQCHTTVQAPLHDAHRRPHRAPRRPCGHTPAPCSEHGHTGRSYHRLHGPLKWGVTPAPLCPRGRWVWPSSHRFRAVLCMLDGVCVCVRCGGVWPRSPRLCRRDGAPNEGCTLLPRLPGRLPAHPPASLWPAQSLSRVLGDSRKLVLDQSAKKDQVHWRAVSRDGWLVRGGRGQGRHARAFSAAHVDVPPGTASAPLGACGAHCRGT